MCDPFLRLEPSKCSQEPTNERLEPDSVLVGCGLTPPSCRRRRLGLALGVDVTVPGWEDPGATTQTWH